MISVGGGSVGLQIGGQAADYVFLIMNPKGIDYLMRSQFTLGGDAAVAAGPVGRTGSADTDLRLRAEILSYSRTRGLFAGLSLEGTVVKQDKDANENVYGEQVDPRKLLHETAYPVPPAARDFVELLATTVAAIRTALRHPALDHLAIAVETVRLENRPFVGGQPNPGKAVDDRIDRCLRRTLAIGVLDAQNVRALVVPRVKPRIQRGSDAADVQIAGGARGKAGTDGHAWHALGFPAVGAPLREHSARSGVPDRASAARNRRASSAAARRGVGGALRGSRPAKHRPGDRQRSR
jgi:hypothetical protein